MRGSDFRGSPQVVAVGDFHRGSRQERAEFFRTHERGALEVKPVEGFSFGERVRQALAEAKLIFRDRSTAAAAFGASARGGLYDVRHP